MLVLVLLAVLGYVNGQSDPTIYERNFYVIDTCVNTSSSINSQSSQICHCSDLSVHCNFYSDDNCTEWDDNNEWGGCDSSFYYRVDNCEAAQDIAATLAESGDSCPYWVNSGGSIFPVNKCRDYGCNGYDSCMDQCSGNDIERGQYSEEYDCGGIADDSITYTGNDIRDKNCGGQTSSDCAVTVTTYYLNGNTCGSKKSPFKTSKSTKTCKHWKNTDNSTPIPIGKCFETRKGYYSYSSKYLCNDEGDAELWHYLDTGSCSGDGYKVKTISNLNHTVVCEGSSSCGGTVGFYADCSNYNWDYSYSETPVLFGICTSVWSDPDEGGVIKNYEQPWYQNVSVVYTCNSVKDTSGGKYPSVYYFPDTSDCSGAFIFEFDYYDRISQVSTYEGLKCAYPQVSGCSQGSTVDSEDVPSLYTCGSAAFQYYPQFGAIFIGVLALLF